MLVDLTEDEIAGVLTYMYYGIDECGEIGNAEQDAYTKLYNALKDSNCKIPSHINEPDELTCYNSEAEDEDEDEDEEEDTKDTGLSEQERWLIEALKDDPHDNRWED